MRALIAFLFCACCALPAYAESQCTLLVSFPDAQVLREEGDCGTRTTPASTFKIPLALMGFDSGILKNADEPSLPYKPEYNGYETQRKTTDPTLWEKESIVWYSQQLTQKLGMEKFRAYVEQFDYGNKDVSGDPGKDNGLTHAWLSSSLQISPKEQADFLAKMLAKKFDLSGRAYGLTQIVMPEFVTKNGWTVFGKTGTGEMGEKPVGWFVGWATNGRKNIVFAVRQIEDTPVEALGPKVRDAFLKEVAGWGY